MESQSSSKPVEPGVLRYVFFRSIRIHLRWFLTAFRRAGREKSPLTIYRLAVLLVGFPLYLGLQLMHWGGFLLDEILYRRYRNTAVASPLFITGIPRSGTTFLHRALSHDTQEFTTFSTWEAILAPSITGRKCCHLLAAVDRLLGAPISRLINFATRRIVGDFSAIHEVGLDAPEEDYLALLPAGACFILVLAFPAHPELWALAGMDRHNDRAGLSAKEKQAIVGFYRLCVQKHLFVEGQNRRFLSKNAAFATWILALREEFPDSRFIICVRNPESALSSQLSSLEPGRRCFGTDPDGTVFAEKFQEIYCHAYDMIRRLAQDDKACQLAIVEQTDLRRDPQGTIRRALDTLDMEISISLRDHLSQLQQTTPRTTSEHSHQISDQGLTSGDLDSAMRTAYEEILKTRASTTKNNQNWNAGLTEQAYRERIAEQ